MLELGLTFDYGQLVIDNEIALMNRRVLEGILFDRETMGLDTIKKVGFDGHFMREKHTRAFAGQEQSKSKILDRRMRGAWLKRGGEDVHARALAAAREIIATHRVEPLSPEADSVIADVKDRVG